MYVILACTVNYVASHYVIENSYMQKFSQACMLSVL